MAQSLCAVPGDHPGLLYVECNGVSAGSRVSVPVHLRWKFAPSGRSLMFHIVNLVFIGQLIADDDTIAATIALRVT